MMRENKEPICYRPATD